jgi:hypothetical protein
MNSSEEYLHIDPTKGMIIKQAAKYICEKHGETVSFTVNVTMPGSSTKHDLSGDYCFLCAVEKMVECGVNKVTTEGNEND